MDSAFLDNQIKKLKLPNIESIGDKAFHSNKIEEIEFHMNDSKLKNIMKWAFKNNNIKELKLPPSITLIDEYAFSNNNLINITFPDIIDNIKFGKGVFRHNYIGKNKQELYLKKLKIKDEEIIKNLFIDQNLNENINETIE